ncbi:hypothetical protein MGN70_012060 [Eutypa lata]|nr:hypothetical protein MGN70_012060 [Eutypa lata]
MGGEDEIDTWRVDRLADEPIYCAVPTPPNPDDILYYGSDEELDDAAKVAKRLRYEQQGLRYLRGQPLQLLSTTLRGPFDKASGWRNPWLPQVPNKIQSEKKISKNSPAIKKGLLRDLKLRAAAENSTPGTDNSMQCHLPSPESNRGAEAFHEYLSWEKHGRIRAWARGISTGPLERDSFWAPENTSDEENEDKTRKRHAAEEWLRKKPTKRNRLNITQSTGAASTPTPLPISNPPIKPVSASVQNIQRNKQKTSQECIGRSFELTTPSSTADQRSAKPIDTQPAITSLNGDMQSVDGLATVDEATESLTSSAASTTPRKPLPNESKLTAAIHESSTTSSELSSVHEDEQNENDDGTPPEAVQSEPKSNKTSSDEEETHEDDNFESFLDQSFHFRARIPKQETPVEENSNTPAEDLQRTMHLTVLERQDGTDGDKEKLGPAEEKKPVSVEMASVASGRDSTPSSAVDSSPSAPNIKIEPQCTHNSTTKDYPTEEGSERNSTASPESSKAGNVPIPVNTGPETIQSDGTSSHHSNSAALDQTGNPEVLSETYPPLKRDHSATEESRMAQSPQSPVKKMRLSQSRRSQEPNDYSEIRLQRMDSEPVVDEGNTSVGGSMDATLVGDCMDVDEPSAIKPAKSPKSTYHTGLATRDADIVSTVPAASNKSSGSTNGVLEDESGAESERIILPLSQLEWGVVNSKEFSSSKPTSNYTPKPTAMQMKGDPQDSKENIPISPSQLNQNYDHQSPWVPHYIPGDEVQIKSEPIEEGDDDRCSPNSIGTYCSSPRIDQQEPAIRASQQSPWATHTPLPSMSNVRDYKFNIADIESVSSRIKEIQNEQRSIYEEESSIHTTSTTNQASPLPIPAEIFPEQNGEVTNIPSPRLGLQALAAEALGLHQPPSTSAVPEARASTPEPEISIKSFAKFNTPSPVRRRRSSHRKPSGRRSGILLVSTTPLNPWSNNSNSVKSSSTGNNRRRVSFAPLPGDDDNNEDASPPPPSSAVLGSATPPTTTRAASPPPPKTTIEAGDEDVNDTFHKHFDAVKKRRQRTTSNSNASDHSGGRGNRLQQRLLPSLSQQKPASPDVGAMAAAFQEADALLQENISSSSGAFAAADGNDVVETDAAATAATAAVDTELPGEEQEEEEADVHVPTAEAEAESQSPWRSQSQTQHHQQVDNDDDVAAVLGNLDQFLDAWDVDAAMRRATFDGDESAPALGKDSGMAVDALQGIGVWD